MSNPARYRPLAFGITRARLRHEANGVQYLNAEQALQPYAHRITDRLLHWARTVPERTWMARRARDARGASGDWCHIRYAQALASARSIGQALLDRGLNVERPVAILSENDLEHAQLALGCIYAGVPYCSVSPAYATVSTDYEKLRHVLGTLTPGLVFASDGARYARAIQATVDARTEVVLTRGAEALDRLATPFDALLATAPTPAVDAAMQTTGPDTIVKFLFTSGSTRLPKAVINTQRMWCANQQQMRQSMPVLEGIAPNPGVAGPPEGVQSFLGRPGERPDDAPLVLIDWLPWNHTFGGNHNYGMVLYNGGTLYIDDGKPVPALIGETLRNLREIAPTVYFNVPTGFEAIADAMKTDMLLRKTLLSRVRMFFYAGAALAQPVWDSLHASQEAEIGERIVMGTGLGMTESGPFGLFVTGPDVRSGDLGLPTTGLELKLVSSGDKTEVRYRGPNVTPGYWRAPQETAESFDEEGFFRTGDAVRWIDPDNIHLGLKFDGRIAEDFKLATGTFVSVGPLRAKIIAAGAPYVQDAVITGLNEKEVGALLFPTAALRDLGGLAASAPMADVIQNPRVRQWLQELANTVAAGATGSANRVTRWYPLADPPSIDRGEVTDKGSINQRAVLKHRAALVEALHAGTLPGMMRPHGDPPSRSTFSLSNHDAS